MPASAGPLAAWKSAPHHRSSPPTARVATRIETYAGAPTKPFASLAIPTNNAEIRPSALTLCSPRWVIMS